MQTQIYKMFNLTRINLQEEFKIGCKEVISCVLNEILISSHISFLNPRILKSLELKKPEKFASC